MGSAAEFKDPTTGTEKHHQPLPFQEEEEDEQVFKLERKKTSKVPDSTDASTVTTSTSSSPSYSGGDATVEISDLLNGKGDHIAIENLEVPESPEKETEIELHANGNNCIVYFDGEQGIWKCRHCDWTYKEESLLCFETKGTESAGAEPDAHESQAAGGLKEEKKDSGSANGSTSGDNKTSREIEEVQGVDFSKDLPPVDLPTSDVIEEELDFEDAEYFAVEEVLKNQKTHDLICPKCNADITERVILKRRKRIPYVPNKRIKGPQASHSPYQSVDNVPAEGGGENPVRESFVYKCLSCFNIFRPSRDDVEGLETQPKAPQEAVSHSNWFTSIFKKKESAVTPGGAMATAQGANTPTEAPALVSVQGGSEISTPPDKKPGDTTLTPVAPSHDTSNVVNSKGTDGQKDLVPSTEEETQQKIDENHASGKVSLSPIPPSCDIVTSTVSRGPDGGVTVETTFHPEGTTNLIEGTGTSHTTKPDFAPTKVPGVMDTSVIGIVTGPPNPSDALPVSSPGEETLTEPLLGPVVEGRGLEILKSIVYGGLMEAITSLGVISSAAGSGATMLNILVLGIANLMGGLILMIHNLQELRDEVPRITTTEQDQAKGQEEGRYKRLLGRKDNFTLHATVAILSFIVVGLVPPGVYYFSFNKTHNRDYKVASVFASSLAFIVLLATAKARVNNPRGSYYKSILYYTMMAVSVSGISYVVGKFVDHLLEKYGWSDGSETPAAGEMMLSLMGRRAGNFGHSSSY